MKMSSWEIKLQHREPSRSISKSEVGWDWLIVRWETTDWWQSWAERIWNKAVANHFHIFAQKSTWTYHESIGVRLIRLHKMNRSMVVKLNRYKQKLISESAEIQLINRHWERVAPLLYPPLSALQTLHFS